MGKKRTRDADPVSTTAASPSAPHAPAPAPASTVTATAKQHETGTASSADAVASASTVREKSSKKAKKSDKTPSKKHKEANGAAAARDQPAPEDDDETATGDKAAQKAAKKAAKEAAKQGLNERPTAVSPEGPGRDPTAKKSKRKEPDMANQAETVGGARDESGPETKRKKKDKKGKKTIDSDPTEAATDRVGDSSSTRSKSTTVADPAPTAVPPHASTSASTAADPLFDFAFTATTLGPPRLRTDVGVGSSAKASQSARPSTSEATRQDRTDSGRSADSSLAKDIPVDPVLLAEGRARDGSRNGVDERSSKDKKGKGKGKETRMGNDEDVEMSSKKKRMKRKRNEEQAGEEESTDGAAVGSSSAAVSTVGTSAQATPVEQRSAIARKKGKDKKKDKEPGKSKKAKGKEKEVVVESEAAPQETEDLDEDPVAQARAQKKHDNADDADGQDHRERGKTKQDKGKGKEVHDEAADDEDEDDGSEGEPPSASKSSANASEQNKNAPSSASVVSKPRVPRGRSTAPPTHAEDDGESHPDDRILVSDLEKDPDFVWPEKKVGPFWDILQSKWTPVKELKKLSEEYGEDYRQGKFSVSEDKLIRATINSFLATSGMSRDELVKHIQARRRTVPEPAEVTVGKRASKAMGASVREGPLTELWLSLGQALQSRALLGIWNHVRRMYHPDRNRGPWTAEEDELLTQAVKEYGASSWEQIAASVGRISGDCRDRWTKQLGGGKESRKGRWTPEEEEELVKLHAELGASWTAISARMKGLRTPTQCRIKWQDSLARREIAKTPDPERAKASTSSATMTEDREGTTLTEGDSWRWQPENYSTLIHAVAAMKEKHEADIDWTAISAPSLKPHGPKNLRDRFRYLRESASIDLRERDGLDEDAKIPFKAVVKRLLELYPESGKAYKRTYRAAEKKRAQKLADKEAAAICKANERRQQRGSRARGVDTVQSSKSAEFVHHLKPSMTRSRHHDKIPSIHAKPNPIPMKKSGHGAANWGALSDEIHEGIDLSRTGEYKLPHSPEEMGAHKLAISPSSEKTEHETLAPLANVE
ncbi:hypothetical protein JCM10212_006148 [Sporobolomyces blumeae]